MMNRFETPAPVLEKTKEIPSHKEAEKKPLKSFSKQLAEYITGIELNDPVFLDRLIRDQNVIRARYHLPERGIRFDEPSEYERILREMAKNLDVKIRAKSECGKFFTENIAGGVFSAETNKIGVDINKNNLESYQDSLGIFEHELIHAFQEKQSPGMPIELMEYEAYIAGFNLQFLQKKQEERNSIEEYLGIMFNMIGGSVGVWYKVESERRNMALKPTWYKE